MARKGVSSELTDVRGYSDRGMEEVNKVRKREGR